MLRRKMPEHMEAFTKEHLDMVTREYERVNKEFETLKEHTLPMKDVKNIECIYISNLANDTNDGMLRSRFGQFGMVMSVQMIETHHAAIIKFHDSSCYTKALESSYLYGINLLQYRLRVTPIYNSSAKAERPPTVVPRAEVPRPILLF